MVMYKYVLVMKCAFLLQAACVVEGNSSLLCKSEMNTFRAQTSRAHCPLQTQNKQLCRVALRKELKKEVKGKDEEVSRWQCGRRQGNEGRGEAEEDVRGGI